MKSTGAVLAAAGLSSRMGDLKLLLPFGDSTIAFHITSMLRRLGADPVIVVTGYRAEELEDHLKGTGACFVRNTGYCYTQMFDSVKLGIQAALEGCDRIMVMPMDLPAITDDIMWVCKQEISRRKCKRH